MLLFAGITKFPDYLHSLETKKSSKTWKTQFETLKFNDHWPRELTIKGVDVTVYNISAYLHVHWVAWKSNLSKCKLDLYAVGLPQINFLT